MREMKEIIRVHKPIVIILLEPKISREMATEICKRLKKSHWTVMKQKDLVGGGNMCVMG